MSDTTAIEWTDATWNPVTGCSKVSPGCAHCFAETLALTRLAGKPGYPGLPWTPENAGQNVVLHPDRLDLPLRWRTPRRVFVNSMSDLFHERVPLEFIARVFNTMACATATCGKRHKHEEECWQGDPHQFQVLTKRPERMRDAIGQLPDWVADHWGGDWPLEIMMEIEEWPLPNVWLGTSIENNRWTGRADALRETPAAVRFISAEPLLGPLPSLDLTGIDWLIIGGESGPGFRLMDLAWVDKIIHRADRAGVPVFIKQDSGSRPGKQGRLPDDLWARKEYPTVHS
jgi:protein gp37